MTRRMLSTAVAAALLALPGVTHAQDKPKPEAAKPEAPKADTAKEGAAERHGPQGVTLRVQLVISRFQGERKVASLPYTLLSTTGGGRARMRMGVDTPVPVTSTSESGKQTTSIQYRNVGTNIDCGAFDKGDGRYQLNISVENSSALAFEKGPSSGNPPPVEGGPTGVPLFRSFNTSFDLLLRDGQSLQTVASTDPVTGEVVKIDVTMNVVR
jgi:Bacterial type II and III secretion system protein